MPKGEQAKPKMPKGKLKRAQAQESYSPTISDNQEIISINNNSWVLLIQIVDIAKCLYSDAKLPSFSWGQAMLCYQHFYTQFQEHF